MSQLVTMLFVKTVLETPGLLTISARISSIFCKVYWVLGLEIHPQTVEVVLRCKSTAQSSTVMGVG